MSSKNWFESSHLISADLNDLKERSNNLGVFFKDVVGHMPGITDVELISQEDDRVEIRTNEGLMNRFNIIRTLEENRILLEYEEDYKAGRMVTVRSHYKEEFVGTKDGIQHSLKIGNVKAPGITGYFYKTFGARNIGKAVLSSYKKYLEA